MPDIQNERPKPGSTVVLKELPPGLLDNLPDDDQQAISEIVGRPILLVEYDGDGRAELEFEDRDGVIHFIYVDSRFIEIY
ncbi:MAG TPA: hypothetical protein VNW97_21120 [Candidatus Saccharimonadales bacterium]|jgi:hypothetical protein|nr:hypothetical protein [Candidatus Saccharimonadales bacterium]